MIQDQISRSPPNSHFVTTVHTGIGYTHTIYQHKEEIIHNSILGAGGGDGGRGKYINMRNIANMVV